MHKTLVFAFTKLCVFFFLQSYQDLELSILHPKMQEKVELH